MAKPLRKTRKRGTVAIVGLGYVGLPLACLAAEKGFRVFGIGRDKGKIALINARKSPIKDRRLQQWLRQVSFEATTDFSVVKKASFVVICVPTPVDHSYNPDLGPVRSACESLLPFLKKGQIVILESTVNPGVCEEVVLPILAKSGLKVGKDIHLAHCPERINPGDKKWTVRNIPRVIGATDPKGLTKAVAFYQSIIEAPVRPMRSIKEAEATKILENAFRDVNIAFVNEIAQSFDKLGIDVLDVIEGAKTKPFAFMAHYPSCGIGGHCIPVDPYYLIERAKKSGFDHKFLKLAREINNGMPAYTVGLLVRALNDLKRSVKGTRVGVAGIAYKADIDDTRESPSYVIIHLLKELGADVQTYDPHVPRESNRKSLEDLLAHSDALVVATAHREFVDMDYRLLKKHRIKVVIDGKNCLDKDTVVKHGIIYKGISR